MRPVTRAVGRPQTTDGTVARTKLKLVERNSPLHWAAFKGNLKCVWKLMATGLSIHDVDHCGNTALHLAVAGGHVDVMICLLQNGADLFSPNYYGTTSQGRRWQCAGGGYLGILTASFY